MAVWWEIFCRYVWYNSEYSRCIFMCFFGRLGNKNYAHLEPSEEGSKSISAKRWTQTKEELSSLNISRGIRSQYVMGFVYFWSNKKKVMMKMKNKFICPHMKVSSHNYSVCILVHEHFLICLVFADLMVEAFTPDVARSWTAAFRVSSEWNYMVV